ncbi:hypothetical protein D3C80_1315320 [compost metagenome]
MAAVVPTLVMFDFKPKRQEVIPPLVDLCFVLHAETEVAATCRPMTRYGVGRIGLTRFFRVENQQHLLSAAKEYELLRELSDDLKAEDVSIKTFCRLKIAGINDGFQNGLRWLHGLIRFHPKS